MCVVAFPWVSGVCSVLLFLARGRSEAHFLAVIRALMVEFRQWRRVCLVVCLAVAFIAIVPTIITKKLNRWQGALMVCIYIGYVAVLVTNSSMGYLPF